MEEEDENENIEEQGEIILKSKKIIDTSNQLNSEHKRYKTYSTEYKKQLIQEVK